MLVSNGPSSFMKKLAEIKCFRRSKASFPYPLTNSYELQAQTLGCALRKPNMDEIHKATAKFCMLHSANQVRLHFSTRKITGGSSSSRRRNVSTSIDMSSPSKSSAANPSAAGNSFQFELSSAINMLLTQTLTLDSSSPPLFTACGKPLVRLHLEEIRKESSDRSDSNRIINEAGEKLRGKFREGVGDRFCQGEGFLRKFWTRLFLCYVTFSFFVRIVKIVGWRRFRL